MAARLLFFPGSPFARMARVLIREWSLPIVPEECPFPPGPELWETTPAGQVPVLVEPDRPPLFPTFLILERLWEIAGSPRDAYEPDRDRQVLLATLQAGDALVTAYYIGWTGLRETETNHVGYSLRDQNLLRFGSVLRWLDGKAAEGEVRDGVTLPGVALACLALWADARDGFPWRENGHLARLVDDLASRASFAGTAPQRWSPTQ
jgi:glutathione S-transferase